MRENATANPGHKALRRGRFSCPNQVYLLTWVTHKRVSFFARWEAAWPTARKIADATLWRDSSLLCWVLMPDHVHVVVALGDVEPLHKLVKRVKSVLAGQLRRECGERRRVWAPAYHDHALRDEDSLVDVARYVVLNPVRAGLVRRVADYPFWDAVWLGGRP